MGLFNNLFGKGSNDSKNSLNRINAADVFKEESLTVDPEILGLLWIDDGPMKNYVPNNHNKNYEYNGIHITVSFGADQEPSLLNTHLPIKVNADPQQVENPPYYPTYAGLTEAQRGVYWKLLADPYTGKFNIGYVFLLYYGLERQLLEGKYEEAFHVILKLRDVYENKSFQSYSACALILTCMLRKRTDLLAEFFQSLDKEYEFNFSSDLYLFCKAGLCIPLTAHDIMRMSDAFGFTNKNYIKKYPDLFAEKLTSAIEEKYNTDNLEINNFVKQSDWSKMHKSDVNVFANVSISDQSVKIPLVSENFKLKKAAYDLLETAHGQVKLSVAQMRKDGILPEECHSKPNKEVKSLVFDSAKETELIDQYNKEKNNAYYKHFDLMSLQDFYYKYRELDAKYLDKCIDYCYEDIANLPHMQEQYVNDERENINKYYSKEQAADMLSKVQIFNGDIFSFKRLSVIYEKSKEYNKAIDICDQAIKYYNTIGVHELVSEFEQRKQKIQIKKDHTSC